MHDRAPPDQEPFYQQFAFLIAFEGGMSPSTTPPAHHGEQRRTKLHRATHHDHCQPMHPGHKNGATGRIVVARFDVGQAFGFARAHCTQALRSHTFRLFPLTTIPNRERVFSLLLPAVHPASQLVAIAHPPPPAPSTWVNARGCLSAWFPPGPCLGSAGSPPIRLRASRPRDRDRRESPGSSQERCAPTVCPRADPTSLTTETKTRLTALPDLAPSAAHHRVALAALLAL